MFIQLIIAFQGDETWCCDTVKKKCQWGEEGCQPSCAVIKTLHTQTFLCASSAHWRSHTHHRLGQVQVYLEFVFAQWLRGEEIWVADLGGDHLAHTAGSGCGLLGPISSCGRIGRPPCPCTVFTRWHTRSYAQTNPPPLPLPPANPTCTTWDCKAASNGPFSPLKTHGRSTEYHCWMGPNMGLITARGGGCGVSGGSGGHPPTEQNNLHLYLQCCAISGARRQTQISLAHPDGVNRGLLGGQRLGAIDQ